MKEKKCDYTDIEILKYAGSFESINPVRRIEFVEGAAKSLQAFDICCLGGLHLIVGIDRGLDILSASYKGTNLSFMSKNAITGTIQPNPHEDEFLRYFTGGLLTTCGLRNAGPSCREESGEFHPLHGRINTIPARDVCVTKKTRHITVISGTMRETALFGHSLALHRKITIDAINSKIAINDTLENESAHPEEFMILYHYNFGFPFLREGCKLEFEDNDEVTPRTEHAKKGLEKHKYISAPDDNYEEEVFFHMQKGDENSKAGVKVINPELKLAATLTYGTKTLPILAQWKSMRSGDYALGLEPSNNYIKGRVEERKNNTIKSIEPYSKIEFETSVEIDEI